MEKITDLQTLKNFFSVNVKTPIFGVGVYGFDRLGLEDIVQNYRLLVLRHSLETELIEKELEVISLEKGMGTKHLVEPRNSTTVITSLKIKEYLSKYEKPLLIPYKASYKMERICRQQNWTMAASPVKFGKSLLEDKAKFRKILQDVGVDPPPGELIKPYDLNFAFLKSKYGPKFVVQHPRRGGGKGTFFIEREEDWNTAIHRLKLHEKEGEEFEEDIQDIDLVAAKYIEGPSCSITGCVTRYGILSTYPQYQIIDAPELYNPDKGSGLFCGHDWSSSRFSENIAEQAYKAVERIGEYFCSLGYKGIFGLDFIMDRKTQKLFVTECNPRLLGSFPIIAMIQILNNEPSILAFHVLEYLNAEYEMDTERINSLMHRPKFGAQMFLHNLTQRWSRNRGELKAGVYRIKSEINPSTSSGQESKKSKINDNDLEFLRPGYAMKHLKNEDEFLLTDGVLQKGSHFSLNRRLCRILTLGSVLSQDNKTLNPWAKEVAKTVHECFNLKPIRFSKLIRVFNPNFLAKG